MMGSCRSSPSPFRTLHVRGCLSLQSLLQSRHDSLQLFFLLRLLIYLFLLLVCYELSYYMHVGMEYGSALSVD